MFPPRLPCFISFRSISQTFSSQAFFPLPRSESQATVLFCPPLNSLCVQPDGAVLITSDLTVIGPILLHQGDTNTAWAWPIPTKKAPVTLEWGAAPWEPAVWTIWGGEGAGHPNSPLPSIMWALCCAYPETLWLYHLLSFYPAREGGISLPLPVQSGQRGRDQSTWIKGLVCSRQSWNWSITGLHLRSAWEGVAGPSTEGFSFCFLLFPSFVVWLEFWVVYITESIVTSMHKVGAQWNSCISIYKYGDIWSITTACSCTTYCRIISFA